MKPLRFRGVPLEPLASDYYEGEIRGARVCVFRERDGWNCKAILLDGELRTPVGASSPESALRSLLGVIGNAHRELGKVLEPVRKAKR